MFVITYVDDRFYLWQFMFITDFFCGNIFVIVYKYFYDNFYSVCVATYILYVWQLMCMQLSVFVAPYCITYSNLLLRQNIFKIYASGI